MDVMGLPGRGHIRPAGLAGLVAGGLGLAVAFAAPATGASQRSVTSLNAVLTAVSADSATDGWAVGIAEPHGGAEMLRWNGTGWAQVTIPQAASYEIDGVKAISPSDAWAVGGGPARGGFGTTATLHWNGTSWARVASPSPGKGSGLLGISALAANDAWAVGVEGTGPQGQSAVNLALHWNGTAWAKVSVPSPNNQSELKSVSADSPSDAWAVGQYFAGARILAQIVHWNGSAWSKVPSPNPGRSFIILYGVSAVSGNDAWAVGTDIINRQQNSLVLHWNGKTWTQMPSPGGEVLQGVSATSRSDVWAVGAGLAGNFVAHWNGTNWTPVASPSPGGTISGLAGVSAVSPSDAWAAGCECGTGPHGPTRTVLLHWNGTHWVRT